MFSLTVNKSHEKNQNQRCVHQFFHSIRLSSPVCGLSPFRLKICTASTRLKQISGTDNVLHTSIIGVKCVNVGTRAEGKILIGLMTEVYSFKLIKNPFCKLFSYSGVLHLKARF